MRGPGNLPPAEILPDRAAIESELERIAASPKFLKAEQCLRLLRYLVNSVLDGRSGELKEYTLGVGVFERPETFDPRTDPVVRLEARRLRLKLAEYYQQEGVADPLVIDVPKGAYIPHFHLRQAPTVAAAAPAKWLLLPWFVAVSLVLSVFLGAWYMLAKTGPSQVVRTSVAVLGFRDLSSGRATSWMDQAVTEVMASELSAGQQLRTLPPEDVARMRRELSLTPQRMYPAELLRRVANNLGADYAVTGAYLPQGDRVHLDAVLFDLRSGRQIAAVGDDANQDKLSGLAQDCARRLRAHLGLRLSSAPGAAYPPVEPAAMEAYARGIERLRQSDAVNALPFLQRAAAAAPANPLVHSALAGTWSMLGLDSRAQIESKLAFEASGKLGRVEQLEIEGRYRQTSHDWPRAIQVYQALFTLLPDDLEYGLLLAHAQGNGGKAQDALATVSALRHLPQPIRDDPRIDLAEAQSAGALADYAHTRKAAHTAAEKARQRGARLQYARARLLESGAMQNLDAPGFADVRAEARAICAELGDRACVAAAYRIEANALASTGSPAKARPLYAEVLKIAGDMGNYLEKLNALEGIAYTENMQGDLKSAEADYREALAVGTEIGVLKRYPVCLELGEVLAAEGRVADARAFGLEALTESREAHDQLEIGVSQADLAHALALQGKYPTAMAGFNEAIPILREVAEPLALLLALLDEGDTQLKQGDLAGALKSDEEAREIDRRHRGFAQPEIELALAHLALTSGQMEEAATHGRAAMNTFAAAGREGDRLEAAALLARALIARGNIEAASGVLAQIPSPDGKPFPIEALVQYRIARCLVSATRGPHTEACGKMDAIAAEVSRLGLLALEKETRVARDSLLKTASAALPH
ncbi:MAG TPA: hypothetical protein VHW09_05795 [Bryobacteraceae bacterium]|jgi:tetratricopeptide (TPR) repeat protein|nr:hypothetical protein [Bryobacteraceae bacterium]